MNYLALIGSFVFVICFQICLTLTAHFYKRNLHSTHSHSHKPTHTHTHARTHVHQSFKTYWVFKCYKGTNLLTVLGAERKERKKEKSLTFSTLYSHQFTRSHYFLFFWFPLRLDRVRILRVKFFFARNSWTLILTLKCVHNLKKRCKRWLRELRESPSSVTNCHNCWMNSFHHVQSEKLFENNQVFS